MRCGNAGEGRAGATASESCSWASMGGTNSKSMAASEDSWAQAQPHRPTPQQSECPAGALGAGSVAEGGCVWGIAA